MLFAWNHRPLIAIILLLSGLTSFFDGKVALANPTCIQELEVLAIVGGFFKTGEKIAKVAAKKGLLAASILPHESFPDGGEETFHPEDYQFHVVHRGNADRTVYELQQQISGWADARGLDKTPRVSGVITPVDMGVELESQIQEILQVPSNRFASANLRVNKSDSGEVFRKNGVLMTEQLGTPSRAAALDWVREKNYWPIMVKPEINTGSYKTFICRTVDEVAFAFDEIYGKWNPQVNRFNDSVLLQFYIRGRQFTINSLNYLEKTPSGESIQRRVPTDHWFQARRPPFPSYVYDHNRIMPYAGRVQEALREFEGRVLDLVEYRVGASHVEGILTDRGIYVIDPNLRLVGGGITDLVKLSTGFDPIEGAIDVATGRAPQFKNLPYQIERYAVMLYLRSHGDGGKMSYRITPYLEDLKAKGIVYDYRFNFSEDEILPKSTNSDSITGWIKLLHPDKTLLKQTIREIRRRETNRELEK